MATSARLDELKKKFDENPRRYFAPLANEYRKQGDTTQAIALCRTHLPNQPGHISGHIVLAQALYESRELVESRQMFEAALELDPENLIAVRYLGDIAREQGAPTTAQAWYRRVLEFDPRNEEISQLLADVRQEADVALSDLASRPTPPTGGIYSLTPDSETTPAAEMAGATELPDEPAALYDADPTGDAWRESMAERAEAVDGLMELSGDLASTNGRERHDVGELEAMAEPLADDWFAAPSCQTPVGAEGTATETDVAPELASAAPEPSSGAVEGGAGAFNWSSVGPEHTDDEQAAGGHDLAGATASDELMDFTPWSAPSEAVDAVSAADAGERRNEGEWSGSPLPSIIDDVDEQPEPAFEPTSLHNETDEPVSAVEPSIRASFEESEAGALFEAPRAHEELIETSETEVMEPPAASPVSQWDHVPATISAEQESGFAEADAFAAGNDVQRIDSVEQSVEDFTRAYDDLPESQADDVAASVSEVSDPLIGRTPSFVPVVRDEASVPFVTETMAELYLQQGFNEEALSIYRQLLARNPNDDALADRVRALESGEASAVVPAEMAPPPPMPASESARSFFARFANRGLAGAAGNASESAGLAATALTVPMAGVALPDEALTRPDEPTLSRIFSGHDIAAGDAHAASTLASAFGAGSEASMSVRSGELSLGQLFRDVPARSSGAVTLGGMGTHSSSGSSDASPAPADTEGEAPADYEQFTAWLEGLKKK